MKKLSLALIALAALATTAPAQDKLGVDLSLTVYKPFEGSSTYLWVQGYKGLVRGRDWEIGPVLVWGSDISRLSFRNVFGTSTGFQSNTFYYGAQLTVKL